MSTRELKDLVNPSDNGDLASIVRRAREMGELTAALAAVLPAEAGSAVVAANVRDDGALVVIAASSAWASRLRFETDTLLEAARSVGVNAHTCRIRVSQA